MRRSAFFLSLAAGLLASLAPSAPAQAGSVLYDATSFVYVYTKSATDVTIEFNQAVTGPVTILPGTSLTGVTSMVSGDSVTFNFTSESALTSTLDFSLYSTTGLVLTGGTISGAGSPGPMGGASGFVTAAVPEPASFALLGIGMAGFFTYRRLFKRSTTV
jgi:hypothetical protein